MHRDGFRAAAIGSSRRSTAMSRRPGTVEVGSAQVDLVGRTKRLVDTSARPSDESVAGQRQIVFVLEARHRQDGALATSHRRCHWAAVPGLRFARRTVRGGIRRPGSLRPSTVRRSVAVSWAGMARSRQDPCGHLFPLVSPVVSPGAAEKRVPPKPCVER